METLALSGSSFVKPYTTGLTATCIMCGGEVFSKCGPIKIHHWAHFNDAKCSCNKTDWHKDWQSRFNQSNREVVMFSESGEKHVADIKTDGNIVIEIQHSKITQEEIDARESHNTDMFWIIDHDFYREFYKTGKVKFNKIVYMDFTPKYLYEVISEEGHYDRVFKISKYKFIKAANESKNYYEFFRSIIAIREKAGFDELDDLLREPF